MGATTSDLRRSRARSALVVAALATLILYLVPFGRFLIYPLLLLSTFVHEMGHGIAAELVGGNFEHFRMWADGSGIASHTGKLEPWARAVVSAGGLVGPPIVAALLFFVARWARLSRAALFAFALFCIASCVLVVRNPFGLFFVGTLAAVTLALAVRLSSEIAQAIVVFLGIQLSLASFSSSDYLFMAEAKTSGGTIPSDTAHIAQALGGAYWMWGTVVGAFSLAVLAVGVWTFWRATRPVT